MVMATEAPQGLRMVPRFTLEVCEGMTIAQAIANADALGGIWTILIHKGLYNEGDLATTGGAIVTLKGIDEGVYIAPVAAPVTAVVNITDTMHLENLTVIAPDATMPAVLVNTPAGAPTITRCNIIGDPAGYGLQMTQGAVNIYHSALSADTHLSTARCFMDCYYTTFFGDLITAAEALNHDIDLMSCEFTQDNINSLATGATVIACEGCSNIDTITNSGTGLFEIRGSYVNSVNCLNAAGEIRLRGGTLNSITRAIGSVVWWRNNVTIDVLPCATATDTVIGHAITAAATVAAVDAEVNVMLHAGLYNEAVTCASYVNLKGIGPKGSVVIYQNNADIITLADNVEVDSLTVRLGTPDAERHLIEDNAVACTARLTNLILEIVAPTNVANLMNFYFTGAGDYTIEGCSFNITYTGNAVGYGVHTSTNAATLHLLNNDFTYLANNAAIHIFCAIGSTITGGGNRWAGTAKMFSVALGTITLDNDAMICTGAWTNASATAILMTLRNCAIEAPVVAGDLAVVRLKNCSYRAISRTGTGNIIDESPGLKDAPWHIEKWDWMTALANAQVAVRGVPLDAGSGQVVIETLDSGAGVMAVETNPALARSLGNHLTPARTPRFLAQLSAHTDNASLAGNPAFDPHVAMFYGLRETLGNALPANPEHHSGFIWTGAAFNASSDDGVATQITALTTPSDDAQHQLEVIVFGGVTTVGWVEFWVDGVLVATHTTRIPVNALDWQHIIIGLGTGGGDTISVTVRPGGTQECPE